MKDKKLKKFETFVQDDIERGDYATYDNDAGEAWWGNLGAGCLIFCKSSKRFLIGHRSKYVNEANCWSNFGGKIDSNENIEDAVKREFAEETKYNNTIELIPAYVFKTRGFKYYNFLGIIENEFKPILDWENDDYKWLNYIELVKIEPKHFGLKNLLNDNDTQKIINSLL